MRVLMLCDVLFPQTTGGAGRLARELALALHRRGLEVHFLTRATSGPSARGENETTYYPPPGRGSPLEYRRIFYRAAVHYRPDVLHVHQPLPAFLCLRRDVPNPVVQTFHSSWPEELKIKSSPWPLPLRKIWAGVFRMIEQKTLRAADVITVLSEYSRGVVERSYHLPATIIPGGVDTRRFAPVDVDRSDGLVCMATVRNLVPRMGLFELIEAMKLLPANFRLDIGGEGPLKARLQERIRSLGLEQKIRIRGHIPDDELPRFYSSADWFILPTVAEEGFGLVILESLACGTPVLGTRVGAIPELLGRFDTAWVIPESTAASIAETVLAALRRPVPSRRELHERVAREFDWDHIAAQYEKVYRSLV